MRRREIRATIDLIPPDDGGRQKSIWSGYRSIARFKQRPPDFGFELELERGELLPGESGVGRLSFWAVDELPELSVGDRFELREGARVVGHGHVLSASA